MNINITDKQKRRKQNTNTTKKTCQQDYTICTHQFLDSANKGINLKEAVSIDNESSTIGFQQITQEVWDLLNTGGCGQVDGTVITIVTSITCTLT